MSVILTLVLAAQMLSAIVMIGLILVQHGKGADMGAAFGGGGSGSLFGASGNFMSRATSGLAAVFFVSTMALSYFGNLRPSTSGSVLDGAAVVVPVPAVPATPAAQIPDNKPVAPAAAAAVVPANVDASKPATQIPTK